jgi:hypothetical protein
MSATANSDFASGIGRTESATDDITAAPYAALSATLDRTPERPPIQTPLPRLWHWLYFFPILARDGRKSGARSAVDTVMTSESGRPDEGDLALVAGSRARGVLLRRRETNETIRAFPRNRSGKPGP